MKNNKTRLIIEDIGDKIRFEMVGKGHELAVLISGSMKDTPELVKILKTALYIHLLNEE